MAHDSGIARLAAVEHYDYKKLVVILTSIASLAVIAPPMLRAHMLMLKLLMTLLLSRPTTKISNSILRVGFPITSRAVAKLMRSCREMIV